MQLLDKNQIKKYSIVLAFLIILLTLIAVLSMLGRNAKNAALQNSAASVLAVYEDSRFTIMQEFIFQQPLKSSVRLYELADKKHSEEVVYAALVRITGFSGPHTCVLVIHPESDIVAFAGIAGYPFPQHSNTIDYGISESMITYWKKNIIEILRTGGVL
ncbi:MAG TPA: hypothetical protein PLR39_03025 [Treponemataceae bacterium]|nr:hypothetical protein [Treponemataceae bacterium]